MLKCFNILGGTLRRVFFANIKEVKPAMGIDEHLAEQDQEALEAEGTGFENFHGFNITSDQAIEAERLGSREDLMHNMERWFGGRAAANQILDERINHRLRTVVAREISLERQRVGFLASKFPAGAGFFGQVRNLFRSSSNQIDTRVGQIYGPDRNVDQIRIGLADNVLNPLTAAQRTAIQTDLATRGVALPPPPPVPVGVNAQVFQLSLAEPEVLEPMRQAMPFFPMPRLDPIFPTREQIPPPTAIERLIRFRNVEALERHKLLSTTVYDPTRLGQFMDMIRHTQPQLNTRINEILVSEALYPIEKHPEAQALIAYLEARMRARGPADMLTELDGIRDNLPAITEKREEGKEPSDELKRLEKVQELTKSISDSYRALRGSYSKAVAQGNTLYEYNRQMAEHRLLPLPTHAADSVGAGLQKSISKAIEDKNKIQVDTNNLERTYRDSATELQDMLTTAFALPVPPATPDPYANLRVFFAAGVPALADSDEDELFGDTQCVIPVGGVVPGRGGRGASGFEGHILGFRPAQMEGMGDEIKTQYHKRFKKRQQVTPRQLLYLLKEGDFVREGVTNPELRRRRALYATNKNIAFVKNMQAFRTTNLELSERHGGSTLGSWRLNRLQKWLSARLTSRQVLETEDLIEYVSGFEKEFAVFKDMPKDITLAELRERFAKEGGVTDAKLFEFTEKLKEAFLSFEMLNKEGKVEIHEGDAMDMEMIIYKLTLLREEQRTRKFFEDIRGSDETKPEAILKKIKEDEAAFKKDELGILGKIAGKTAEWKQLFSKRFVRKKFIESCRAIRKMKKDEKMTQGEFEAKLEEQGLTTPYDLLKGGLMREEALEMAKTTAKWTGGKLATGGSHAKRGGKWIWENAGKPAGKYGIVKPAKFIGKYGIAKPAQFVGKYAIVKPAVVIGKTVAFPFRLAKKIGVGMWNWAKPGPSSAPAAATTH